MLLHKLKGNLLKSAYKQGGTCGVQPTRVWSHQIVLKKKRERERESYHKYTPQHFPICPVIDVDFHVLLSLGMGTLFPLDIHTLSLQVLMCCLSKCCHPFSLAVGMLAPKMLATLIARCWCILHQLHAAIMHWDSCPRLLFMC